jgi:hypothetical protein
LRAPLIFSKRRHPLLLSRKQQQDQASLSMQRITIALFFGLLACLVRPGFAVIGGVLQFTQNGTAVQAPIYQVALGSGGAILWAVAPGGLLYQINATTMQYISSTALSAPTCTPGAVILGLPTCLFVDDVHARIYVCYAPNPGGACMNVFILNSTAGVISSAGYQPINSQENTDYNLDISQHYYDPSSRMLASLSYLPGGQEFGIQLYNVSSDTVDTGGIQIDGFPILPAVSFVSAIWYLSSTDTLYILCDYILASTITYFFNEITFFSGVSAGGDLPPGSQPLKPFYFPPPISTDGQFVAGPMTFTSAYNYAVFASSSIPSQGSYLLQFSNPFVIASPYTPKGAVPFPTQPGMLAVALDETAINSTSGVLFVSTSNGQLLKYRYNDPGGSTTISVVTPNYNTDTLVASTYPVFSYQAYSKTTQAIYLSSASSTGGGIWRVPFYDCGVATSCSSCAALDDPYCGWCPLSGVCTTNASCGTGETTPQTPRTQHNTQDLLGKTTSPAFSRKNRTANPQGHLLCLFYLFSDASTLTNFKAGHFSCSCP